MLRQGISVVLTLGVMAAATAVHAKAPLSKEGMRPIDTSAGSFTDPRHLFQVDLDRQVSVDVSGQPLELAFNQVTAILNIEWGYAKGVDRNTPVSVVTSGAAREVLKAVGKAANVRFEAGGPTQIRVVKARAAPTKKRTLPPPSKRP